MMKHISIHYYQSPVGEMMLGSFEGKLCLCNWKDKKHKSIIEKRLEKALGAVYVEENSEALEKTIVQLDSYFAGERTQFDIPLLLVGTEFQKSVWEGLLKIPYGTTVSYLTLAKEIGNEKAVRAVASANGANSMSIFIPCHRVIGSNGTLTGYAGGLEAKKQLLDLEKNL